MLIRTSAGTIKLHDPTHHIHLHVHAPHKRQQRASRVRHRLAPAAAPQAAATPSTEVDVVVVGSGIIGLLVTRQLLLSSDLSVALFDVKQPCAGATGAGALAHTVSTTRVARVMDCCFLNS
jgi:NADPH-dependent 2,4-dienoyl-CoA reductase/sulfur reductase-like enzyme